MSEKPILPFTGMHERHSGLTRAIADGYSEAARVCLDRHHTSPTEIEIEADGNRSVVLVIWDASDDRTKSAWANDTDATASGAYACALAAVELSKNLVAVHRAETKTGADYYVAPRDVEVEDLEDCIRLEISGVDRGAEALVKSRLKTKLKQAERGESNLPAIAGVVGFKAQIILLAELDES